MHARLTLGRVLGGGGWVVVGGWWWGRPHCPHPHLVHCIDLEGAGKQGGAQGVRQPQGPALRGDCHHRAGPGPGGTDLQLSAGRCLHDGSFLEGSTRGQSTAQDVAEQDL